MIVTKSPFSYGTRFEKFKRVLGFHEANKFVLRTATINHYQACTDKLNPDSFFTHFELPDTMFSFYLVVQLHVWMCQARSMLDGPEGRILRNEVLERMWQDMDVRMERLEVYSASKRKSILKDLLFHHQNAMISYDEGLLTDDKTLAAALWRILFSKEDVDPRVLNLAVRYVRIQMKHIKSIDARHWCLDGSFDWMTCPPLVTKN